MTILPDQIRLININTYFYFLIINVSFITSYMIPFNKILVSYLVLTIVSYLTLMIVISSADGCSIFSVDGCVISSVDGCIISIVDDCHI